MDKKTELLIAQLLKEENIIEEAAIEECFSAARKKQVSPVALIAAKSNVSEPELLETIAAKFQVEYLDLKNFTVDKELIKKIPVKIASYYKFFPLSLENRVLSISVAYPIEIKMLDEIRTHLGYSVKVFLSCEADVAEMLKKYYGLGAATVEKMMQEKTYGNFSEKPAQEQVDDLEEKSEKASVIPLVNQIILEAFTKRATDIHIEPYRNSLRFRYRVDGVLYDANISPEIKHFLTPILSRIKLMSNLNIVERRVPQDGRAIVKVQDQTLDLRVSFIPTPHGESVVIRILPTVMLFGLDRLGLMQKELEFFKNLINKPHGIIFVTGPTGSGKTTTLYACLSTINTSERKIITIEDPIEYEMEGITQIQIAPDIGLDFARGLRSMLRHDPDVMMVGEVRDLETAEIAIRVALTGHLVFSTLHTNDAASGITRLIDIGLEPYLVASSVNAFIAQRLIRVICPHCKQEDPAVPEATKEKIAKELGYETTKGIAVYRGKGCPACNLTGFHGRTAIHEILVLDEGIKELASQKASSDQIKKYAVTHGMRTLRQSGWLKVIQGVTTPDEILRVTQSDENLFEEKKKETQPITAPAAPAVPEVRTVIVPAKERFADKPAVKVDIRKGNLDRRVFERLDEKVYIHYRAFRQSAHEPGTIEYDPVQSGLTKNISAGGALFSSPDSLKVGGVVDVTLELPDGEKQIKCLARIVRCDEMVENKEYEVAVCFLDLPSAERNRLNRYIINSGE